MHWIGTILVRVVTILFCVGLVGSAIVVVLTFVEDIREFNAPEDAADELRRSPPPAETPSVSQVRKDGAGAPVASYAPPRADAGIAPRKES